MEKYGKVTTNLSELQSTKQLKRISHSISRLHSVLAKTAIDFQPMKWKNKRNKLSNCQSKEQLATLLGQALAIPTLRGQQ